jgi:hypothetical protein
MKNIYKKILVLLISVTPNFAFAQNLTCKITSDGSDPKLEDLFNYVTCVIGKSLMPMLFALALAMFTYGVVNFYFLSGDDEAKRNKGKQFMVWGIIALTVMVVVWGLVTALGESFGLLDVGMPQVPETPTIN